MVRELRIAVDEFRAMCQPCVYIVSKEGKPLYVGFGLKGLARVFNQQRWGLEGFQNRLQAFKECDEVTIQFYKTEQEAANEEINQIRAKRPKYNKHIPSASLQKQLFHPRKGRPLILNVNL